MKFTFALSIRDSLSGISKLFKNIKSGWGMSNRNSGVVTRTAAEAAEDAALEEFLKRYPGHRERPQRFVVAPSTFGASLRWKKSTSGAGMWMRVVAIINRLQVQ